MKRRLKVVNVEAFFALLDLLEKIEARTAAPTPKPSTEVA